MSNTKYWLHEKTTKSEINSIHDGYIVSALIKANSDNFLDLTDIETLEWFHKAEMDIATALFMQKH